MLDIYRKLHDLLDARERRNAILLFGMMLIMGLFEAVGVASIMPFVAVLSNPEIVHKNEQLAMVYEFLGFESTDAFLLFLGAASFFLLVGSLAFKALTHWAIARYVHMRNSSLSRRLLRKYLDRPYAWFLNRHSSDLGKSVLAEVNNVVNKALTPFLQILANLVVVAFLLILVFLVEPLVALAVATVLGGAYVLIYWVLRQYLARIGADRLRANRQRYQIAQEALGGIKDVKVLGLEEGYARAFRNPAHRYAARQAVAEIIGELPQFFLRALAFGGMIVILLVLLARGEGNLAAVLPVVALYALAGMRLQGALQKVYKSFTKLRFGYPVLERLHGDFMECPSNVQEQGRGRGEDIPRVPLKECLALNDVHFTYPGADQAALHGLSIDIPACTTVGIVGSTGAGKTTAVDVILGLLEPQSGELRVDGQPITDATRIRAWQKNIGYVPQHIFLTDDTVAANIAFGEAPKRIDPAAVERAARVAELHDFVINELPDGYDTFVGERGVRLSGGQRQRIGIARALYHDPDVLVLDEATSALDNVTEKSVMDAVHNLGHRKTIILIAHRLSTVRECDRIFLLQHGSLSAAGTYHELCNSSDPFRHMALGARMP